MFTRILLLQVAWDSFSGFKERLLAAKQMFNYLIRETSGDKEGNT
jgi:hypothetical protein